MNRFTASKAGWSQRVMAASAVGALTAAVSLAGAPDAFASNNYLEFSLDGKTYSPSISGPIFKETFQYVPGAATGATIWIRNSSGEPARLSSAAVMVHSDPQLDRQIGLTSGLKPEMSTRSALGSQGSCTDLAARELEPGEELELNLVVDLSTDAPNDTMNRSANFDVAFLLESTDAAARSACDALAGPSQPATEPGAAPDSPASTGPHASSSELVALRGTAGARSAPPNGIYPAVLPDRSAEILPPQAGALAEPQPPAGIRPAGFQSTVEPIIRSLSGTLLLAVSVLFAAAVVFRTREGRYE